MHGRQATDALRHIGSQVDRLIELLHSNGGGGAPAAPAPAAAAAGAGFDAEVVAKLQRVASTLEPTPLFESIVDAAVSSVGGKRGFLTMVEEGKKLRFKAGIGIQQHNLAQPEFGPARGAIKQVLQYGTPVHMPPAQTGGFHVLCVPVKLGARLDGTERVTGALFVDSPQGSKALAEAELTLLSQVGDLSGVAVENAFLFERSEQGKDQIERLKDNISKLYDVGKSIASTLVLEELLERVVDHVVQISRAQRGFIMLFEGEGQQRRLHYKVGRDARSKNISEQEFKVSKTLARKAIQEKKSQIMKEALGADLSVSMVDMELQSIMCVPLFEKDEVIGLVYVDSRESNKEFDSSDLDIVESLCGQASVSIVNAQLYGKAAERERLAHELDLASKIQTDLLPKEIPPVDGLEMHGLLISALEVGGDYYDFIPHEGTTSTATIAIGDVSGKGVGAGLVMAMARSALRSLVQHEGVPSSPLPIMKSLNVMMCRDIPPGMFMTLNVLIWDAATRKLLYAPAGHEHLLVYRAATREVEKIKAGGVACGVLKQASAMYREQSLDMSPGDQLLLYTDGVTEAMDILHQPFGLDATVDLVKQYGHMDPKSLCDTVLKTLLDFRGAADPHDDITLVALRVK